MFICHLSGKAKDKLNDVEKYIGDTLFGTNNEDTLDVLKLSERFDLAAVVGRDSGTKQCQTLYARCQIPYEEMLVIMSSDLGPEFTMKNQL